jgi:hypothetical protein
MAWHLAQMNVGTTVAAVESPPLADFMAQLDAINALADASPGFVWRLQTESGNATEIRPSDNPRFIVNMSVWESVEALFAYVYRSDHRRVMVRRREWFEKPAGAYMVLWWVSAGTRPSVEQGLERLRHLDANGPTPHAFTFRQVYPPPNQAPAPQDLRPDPYCVGWS